MPLTKSAKKRARQTLKRRERNKALKTFLKNLRKKTLAILTSNGVAREEKLKALNYYKSQVDKAWSKGVFKKNKSSRLKSKMDILASKILSEKS